MRVSQVIGKVTLSQSDPGLAAGRFLLVSPVASAGLNGACAAPPPLSPEASLVAWDAVGAGLGDIVGVVEGAEATAPFDRPVPIDAMAIALFEQIHYHPAPA
jgi:carbon dioxide concentrating mechanism protein CcmL